MSTVKFEIATVYASHNYQLQLSPETQIRQLARYLTDNESHISTKTLEIATPISSEGQLQDVGLQAGDRVMIFTQPTRFIELPAPLRPGDKVLKFSSGDFEMRIHSKRGVLIGKPDEARQIMPDVDLHYFITSKDIDYISRQCLLLSFDPQAQVWYATKAGQTRIMVNEFELNEDRLPLNTHQVIQFYRGSDDPMQSTPIGEINIQLEDAKVQQNTSHFTIGEQQIPVCIGSEHSRQTIRASEALPIKQIIRRVLDYNGRTLTPNLSVYRVRLAPPGTDLKQLELTDDSFLYAGANMHYAQNFLLLTDIHNPERVYTLSAGGEDEEKSIGCRLQGNAMDRTLDVDLYDALIIRGHDPHIFKKISKQQGRILYRASERTWWVRTEERAQSQMFTNNARITSNQATQLLSGDVLTLGASVDHYYARLELQIITKSQV